MDMKYFGGQCPCCGDKLLQNYTESDNISFDACPSCGYAYSPELKGALCHDTIWNIKSTK